MAPGFGPSGSEDTSSGPFFFCARAPTVRRTRLVRHHPRMLLRMFSRLTLALASLLLPGCLDKPYDPDGPGDFIGVFSVDAHQSANTCGQGALDSPVDWTFDVHLSREIGIIYWNNGAEYVQGELASDKHSFTFDAQVVVNMRDQNSAPSLPPCSVERHDRSSGRIADDDASFTGTLTYEFAPTTDSNCSDLVTSTPQVFAALPCAMTYTLDAKRTATTP